MFHCAPNVPHYAKNKAVGVMKAGHCFTIEPMINVGVWGDQTWPDNWTSVTQVRQTLLPRVYLIPQNRYLSKLRGDIEKSHPFECKISIKPSKSSKITLKTLCKYPPLSHINKEDYTVYSIHIHLSIFPITQDGSLSAQFEQTMVVTDTGVEVLTARPGKRHVPYFMDS